MMPDRDMLAGASEVVWGITTLPNGAATTYQINFGDAPPAPFAAVGDRSYIAVNHTYALSNTYTVTLTVKNGATTETATTTVNVYNGGSLSAEALRELNVNRAIQNGLRNLWVTQGNRSDFDTNIETYWSQNGGVGGAFTALAVQAFQNQGFRLPNSNIAPTGIFAKYAVRRGLNFLLARLTTQAVSTTPAGNDPCVGALPAASKCSALFMRVYGYEGYENGLAMLAFAGSGALARTNGEVMTANVAGQTLGQVLQRLVNASIWGQNDSGTGRGGWYYSFNSTSSDGSVDGWELLGLLDAEAAGMAVPSWVKTEWATYALPNALNNDGSFDYQADGDRTGGPYHNLAKTGIGVQGMFFAGRLNTDPDLALAKTFMKNDWTGGLSAYPCATGENKGCAYGMFNTFKGLKLFGVQTLPGIGRPAGPGLIPSDDWYADYVDWLVANQSAPTTVGGGNWPGLYFSGAYGSNGPETTAIALLILSPTALVLPDPVKFGTVGLQQGSPLSINPATNPVTSPPGTHTVTGITVATNGSPIAGVTVSFKILSGPNVGMTGSGTTLTNGQTTFTYTDTGGAGADNIQANVGALVSNILVKNWVVPVATCDMNNDGKIDRTDIAAIMALANLTPSSSRWDARADADNNGIINSVDTRICATRCSKTSCAP